MFMVILSFFLISVCGGCCCRCVVRWLVCVILMFMGCVRNIRGGWFWWFIIVISNCVVMGGLNCLVNMVVFCLVVICVILLWWRMWCG